MLSILFVFFLSVSFEFFQIENPLKNSRNYKTAGNTKSKMKNFKAEKRISNFARDSYKSSIKPDSVAVYDFAGTKASSTINYKRK